MERQVNQGNVRAGVREQEERAGELVLSWMTAATLFGLLLNRN